MNIRNNILGIAAALMCVAALSSCTKGGMNFFRGSYGYVCSGSIVCESEMQGTVECPVLNESGSLHIEPKGNAAVVTLTSVTGNVQVFDAVVNGSDIILLPISRTLYVDVKGEESQQMTSIPVTMSGKGYKTNGLMVIAFGVSGDDFQVGDDTFTIMDSNIRCVANFRE